MSKYCNPINIGYGWATDIQVTGHSDGDEIRVALLPANGLGAAWPGHFVIIPSDGLVRVRVDGDDTAFFRPGEYLLHAILRRGEASAPIVLSRVESQKPAQGAPIENDPFVGSLAPLLVTLSDDKPLGIGLELVAGIAGPEGPEGPRGERGLRGFKGDPGEEPAYEIDTDGERIRWEQSGGGFGPWLDIGSARKKAEVAAAVAEDFAGDTVAQGSVPIFASRDTASTYNLSAFASVIINRFTSSSELAPAVYRKALSEPAHVAKFQDTTGQWWELAEAIPTAAQFGALPNGDGAGGGTDATMAIQRMIDFIALRGGGEGRIARGTYLVTGTLQLVSNVTVRCDPGARFDCGTSTSRFLELTGTAGQEWNTNSNQTRGDTTVAMTDLAAMAEFTPGSYLYIISQRNALSSDAGEWRLGDGTVGADAAYFAEWMQVAEQVTNLTFRFVTPLIFPNYRTSNSQETDPDARPRTTIRKITPVINAHWIGGEILADRMNNINLILGVRCVDCSVSGTVIRRGRTIGDSVRWNCCLRCVGRDIKHYNDPTFAFDYSVSHARMNRFKTVASQDSGFVGCYSEYGAQDIDFTYSSTDPYVNIRSFAVQCALYRSYEGATSHPGCFQERWDGNAITDCARSGIVVRGLQASVFNNLITGANENNPNVVPEPGIGVDLYAGWAKGAKVIGNRISGFRSAVGVRDATSTEQRFTTVDADISDNDISDCYNALMISLNIGFYGARRIKFDGNSLRRIGLRGVTGSAYCQGVSAHDNIFYGPFLNTDDALTECFFLLGVNSPGFSVQNNRIYDMGNVGAQRVVQIGSVGDTTNYPASMWQEKGLIRNNLIINGPATSYVVTLGSGYQQLNGTAS